MRKNYLQLLFTTAIIGFSSVYAVQTEHNHKDEAEVTFVKNNKKLPNATLQNNLRQGEAWQTFLNNNSEWSVEFNEATALPHRAYGKGIPATGGTPEAKGLNFINSYLKDFSIPANSLVLNNVATNKKYTVVNFNQIHQGLEVLFSRATVRITKDDKIPLFGMDVFPSVNVNTTPSIAESNAVVHAQAGLTQTIESSNVLQGLKILPIENKAGNGYNFHLVYEVEVKTTGGLPGNYYTLVDAHTGDVLYRQNRVHTIEEGNGDEKEKAQAITVTVEGTITDNPIYATYTGPMQFQYLTINSQNATTNVNGVANSTANPTVPANLEMQGLYCYVYEGQSGSNMATYNTSLTTSNPTVNWDNSTATSREISAYYHVNAIHSHMKNWTPTGFTTMDSPLLTRVDRTDGTCNAFYDGNSINFYANGGGCAASALFGDIVYHEYGHGINYTLYQYYSSPFSNGALGEGYADVWAFTLTDNAILAEDFQGANTNIRRYDINPKVYPQDIVGEVHADGEIIAGAWWDFYQITNDMAMMTEYFTETQAATPNAANGQEGVLYRDILLETLMYDDDNSNLNDGTPNGTDICNAFGIHGITLLSNASINHTHLQTAVPTTNIDIDISISGSTTYLGDVKLFYDVEFSSNYTSVTMTNTTSNNYTAQIPGQPDGTIISYYIGVEDNICGYLSSVVPEGASSGTDATLPYFTLIGYDLQGTEDFDFNTLGFWATGITGDQATTGVWEINIPVGSFVDPQDQGTVVQPYYQNTSGGSICAVTGNASSSTAGLGENDVDGGSTTLESDVLNFSAYTDPVVTYYRWYTNNAGANPKTDWFEVLLSNDGGSNWTHIENTLVPDLNWRMNAFRVSDYLPPTSTMMLRFIASDSIKTSQSLDGGSLIEAAIDDIQVWDVTGTSSIEDLANNAIAVNAYPNPANDYINVSYNLNGAGTASIELLDMVGRIVYANNAKSSSVGWNVTQISLNELPAGVYTLNVKEGKRSVQQKVTVIK